MQINHINYPKQLKTKSNESLRYIIKDCQEAITANPENPKCGYYADEINYCASELKRRSNTMWKTAEVYTKAEGFGIDQEVLQNRIIDIKPNETNNQALVRHGFNPRQSRVEIIGE